MGNSAWKKLKNDQTSKVYEIADRKSFEYLIGAFLGDGNLLRSKDGKPMGVQYTVSRFNFAYAKILKLLLEKTFPKLRVLIRRNQKVIRVVVHSVCIARLFFAPWKVNSRWVLHSLAYPEYFLGGVIDTDGHFRKAMYVGQKAGKNFLSILTVFRSLGMENYKVYKVSYTKWGKRFYDERIAIYRHGYNDKPVLFNPLRVAQKTKFLKIKPKIANGTILNRILRLRRFTVHGLRETFSLTKGQIDWYVKQALLNGFYRICKGVYVNG